MGTQTPRALLIGAMLIGSLALTPHEQDVSTSGSSYVQETEPNAAGLGVGYFWLKPSTDEFKVVKSLNPTVWVAVGADGGGESGGGGTVLRVAADVSQSTTTFADVTGLTTAVSSGTTYRVECDLFYTTAISTTALQLSLNGPAMSEINFSVRTSTTATAMNSAVQIALEANTNPATGGGATRLPVRIVGSFIPSANGTLAVRYRSEVAASAVTVTRGSTCVIR